MYTLILMICLMSEPCTTIEVSEIYKTNQQCQTNAHIVAGVNKSHLGFKMPYKYSFICADSDRLASAVIKHPNLHEKIEAALKESADKIGYQTYDSKPVL